MLELHFTVILMGAAVIFQAGYTFGAIWMMKENDKHIHIVK